MTEKWRNTGAPFTTGGGVRVGRGDVFAAARTSRDVDMRRHKLRPVPPGTVVTAGPELERVPDPGAYTVKQLKARLADSDLGPAELAHMIETEFRGKNRDTAVRALKQARDAALEEV